jgi:hypothetical protein
MAEVSNKYQSKVGREQGGNRFYMKEDGEFKFFDTDRTGKELRNFFGSFFTTIHIGASGTGISGTLTLANYYGVYQFSLATGLSLASCNLPSAHLGAILVLDGASMVGDANLIADASYVAGISLVGKDGVDLSSLNLSALAYVKLACASEGVWSVVEANANVTPRAAA